jgi:hypothetical protein
MRQPRRWIKVDDNGGVGSGHARDREVAKMVEGHRAEEGRETSMMAATTNTLTSGVRVAMGDNRAKVSVRFRPGGGAVRSVAP